MVEWADNRINHHEELTHVICLTRRRRVGEFARARQITEMFCWFWYASVQEVHPSFLFLFILFVSSCCLMWNERTNERDRATERWGERERRNVGR